MTDFLIGVDVGTSSVRAGLVTVCGKITNTATYPIDVFNPKCDVYLQSSDNIWNTTVLAIRDVCANVPGKHIKGIGFDATCSLVVLDHNGGPMSVDPDNDSNSERNIIMWMDHRASSEANYLNKCLSDRKLSACNTVNPISLEMQISKILWLKVNMSSRWWDNVGYLIDLSDYLSFRATDNNHRSLCSLSCKWLYRSTPEGNFWDEEFLKAVQLDDIILSSKLSQTILSPGTSLEPGLSKQASQQLDLLPGTSVAVSMIDAHCGALGMLGVSTDTIPFNIENKLGLICGTSSCHMLLNRNKYFVNGVWGPYYDVIVPGYYLSEGGQSSTGKLIDFIIENHPAHHVVKERLTDGESIQNYLYGVLKRVAESKKLDNIAYLTSDVHVWPDFHGNRSPFNCSSIKGMISGLTLSTDETNLAISYLATLQSLVFQTKSISAAMKKSGHRDIGSIVICGGLGSNPLFQRIHADVLHVPVLLPSVKESMILGAAMLAATASGAYRNMNETLRQMSCKADTVLPTCDIDGKLNEFYERKMKVFNEMIQDQFKYAKLMNGDPLKGNFHSRPKFLFQNSEEFHNFYVQKL